MRRFVGFLIGVLAYAVWPAAAAAWMFGRTGQIFRAELVPLPFEIFGTLAAAGMFCFALSASILIVGLLKPRKGQKDETSKNGNSPGVPGGRLVDAGAGAGR